MKRPGGGRLLGLLACLWLLAACTTAQAAPALVKQAPSTPVSNRATLTFFRQDLCIQCAQMQPIVDGLKQEYGDRVNFITLDFDDWSENRHARLIGLTVHPSYAVQNSQGAVLWRGMGTVSEKVLRKHLDAVLSIS